MSNIFKYVHAYTNKTLKEFASALVPHLSIGLKYKSCVLSLGQNISDLSDFTTYTHILENTLGPLTITRVANQGVDITFTTPIPVNKFYCSPGNSGWGNYPTALPIVNAAGVIKGYVKVLLNIGTDVEGLQIITSNETGTKVEFSALINDLFLEIRNYNI